MGGSSGELEERRLRGSRVDASLVKQSIRAVGDSTPSFGILIPLKKNPEVKRQQANDPSGSYQPSPKLH